ncbi:hypothetical protein HCN44_010160 [Aphidius gifuensis]|uniref:Uncharacterized protein n=1 Tax=Aphidius gifuensis TaxID=684658 RepID=A0A834XWL7_APHGI|nr:hypothetical protein HCN44_010160 [Aphidius gifuensis]
MEYENPIKRQKITSFDADNFDEYQVEKNLNVDCLSLDVMESVKFLRLADKMIIDKVFHQRQNEKKSYKTKKIDIAKWINQTENILTSLNIPENLWINSDLISHLTITEYTCDSSVIEYINNNCINVVNLNFKLNLNKFEEKHLEDGFKNLNKLKIFKNTAIIDNSSPKNAIDMYHHLLRTINPEINELYLQSNTSNEMMILLAEDFSLIIKEFENLSDLTLRYFELERIAMMEICKMENLVYLDLHGCKLNDQMPILNLINLEHLNLSSIKYIEANLISQLPRLNRLKHFDVNNSSLSIGMYDSISRIKTLIYLDVKHCSNVDDEFITKVIDNCKYLKHLNVASCSLISSYVLGRIGRLNNLENLNLDNVSNVDKNVIVNLTEDAQKLKLLDISYGENLTIYDIELIGNLKGLESLRINHVTSVDDTLISSIVLNCKNLQHLDLSYSCNLSERAYYDIAQLKYLERLVVVNSLDVQNAVPVEMMKLKYLNCAKSYRVYDEHVEKFIKNCPNLEELIVCQNPISSRIFEIAAMLTNQRKNNIPLTIYTSINLVEFFEETNCQMNLLKLSTECAFKEHQFSYELDD